MRPAAIIYLVTNTVNGKTYVGVTRFTVEKRWRQHRYNALMRRVKTHFYSAMRKHGPEAFEVSPIASCLTLDRDEISEIERSVIKTIKPEYNQTNGGEITVGKRVPREVVDKILSKVRGQKRTPEQCKALSELHKHKIASDPKYAASLLARLKATDPVKRKANRELVRTPESNALMAQTKRRRYQEDPDLRAMTLRHLNKSERGATQRKPVECVTLGVTFDSVSEAARHLRIFNSAISRVCLGKRPTASGLMFRHI